MRFSHFIPALALLIATQSAFAVRIQDITRISGARHDVLTGIGLVIGPRGTGDGPGYKPTIAAMTDLAAKMGIQTDAFETGNGANVALVQVTAVLPADGVRNGDRLDASVASIGAATSLKGGVLYMASLMGPSGNCRKDADRGGGSRACAATPGQCDCHRPGLGWCLSAVERLAPFKWKQETRCRYR
jgi:flagellar P-ring protein precursor FlgI